jgi:hypothetical protein
VHIARGESKAVSGRREEDWDQSADLVHGAGDLPRAT